MTLFSVLSRQLGLTGCALLLALAFYEGVPGINRLPFLEHVPLLREFGVGRVELARREAVKGLVERATLDALAARLDEERRLRSLADAAAAVERERAASLSRIAADRQAELERKAVEAERAPGLTRPSREDLQWLAR